MGKHRQTTKQTPDGRYVCEISVPINTSRRGLALAFRGRGDTELEAVREATRRVEAYERGNAK